MGLRTILSFTLICLLVCEPLVWNLSGHGQTAFAEEAKEVIGTLKEQTPILIEPVEGAAILWTANKGETGHYLGKNWNGEYLKLKFSKGLEGWVPYQLVQISGEEVEVPDLVPVKEEQVKDDKKAAEKEKEKVLVAMDLTSEVLLPGVLAKYNDLAMNVLRQESGTSLITQSELKNWTEFAVESDQLDCSENKKCIMDISRSVNNDLFFGGKIGKLGDIWTVTLNLIDSSEAQTIGSVSKEARSLDELEQAVKEATVELVKQMTGVSKSIVIDLSALGENPRIAVMDFQATGVEKSLAQNLTDIMTVELKQFENVEVISRQDIAAMLTFEAVKQDFGCEDDTCFMEIGAALGVGFLVVGNVGQIENTYILGLKVIDIRNSKIIGREQENFVGPADGLLPAARFLLRRVFGIPYKGDGLLKLTVSEKNANVSLDGKDYGEYPDLKLPDTIPSGKYRVNVEKDSFYPLARDIYIEPARQTHVQIMLEEEPAEWWETWWFWTVVGTVVAGGVATGIVLGTKSTNTQTNTPAAEPATGTAKFTQ